MDKKIAYCVTVHENQIEDEYHALLSCPSYEDLRKMYLCNQCDRTFTIIMCCQNQNEIVPLVSFVLCMFK